MDIDKMTVAELKELNQRIGVEHTLAVSLRKDTTEENNNLKATIKEQAERIEDLKNLWPLIKRNHLTDESSDFASVIQFDGLLTPTEGE